MTQQFQLIASVTFHHRYFHSGVFDSLKIQVDENSIHRLRTLELVVREFSGGFRLLCANPENLAADVAEEPLRFILAPDDALYLNYTEADDVKSFGFSNIAAMPHLGLNGHTLHEGEFAGSQDYLPENAGPHPFGFVDLYVTDLIDEFTLNGRVNYIVSFNARSTIWKYFVSDHRSSTTSLKDLHILSDHNRYSFSLVQPQNELEQKFSWIFQSQQKIPLSEISGIRCRLVGRKSDAPDSEIIIESLPSASPTQIYSNNSDGVVDFYSIITINL